MTITLAEQPLTSWLFYLASISALTVALHAVHRTSRALGLPVFQAVLVSFGALTYLSMLIPGALGILTPFTTTLTAVGLAIVVFELLRQVRAAAAGETAGDVADRLPPDSWTPATILIAVAGTTAAQAFFYYLWTFFIDVLNPSTRGLPWDTVSYHLPGVIEFIQNQTLWSVEGPYQFYSFGFELIGTFFSHFFQSHWGLHVANLYSVIFLIVSIARVLGEFLLACRDEAVARRRTACFLLAFGLWCVVLVQSIHMVGKNDIFAAACILTTFSLILRWSRSQDSAQQRLLLLILATVASGLALAAKPTSLAYAPLFFLIVLFLAPRPASSRSWPILTAPIGMLLGSLAVGSFFYLRNLAIFGQLTDPLFHDPGIAGSPWKLSLLSNLKNQALYDWNPGSAGFVCALLTLLTTVGYWWSHRSKGQISHAMLCFVALHVVSCLAFAITPHAVFHASLDVATWELRLGMPFMTLSALMAAVLLVKLVAYFEGAARNRPRIATAAAAVLVLGVAMGIGRTWLNPEPGLAGFEVVRPGLPRTAIYRWIQQLKQPVRIYSAGLRPYGLYGPRWENRVFYDLHSTILEPAESGKRRLVGVLEQFEPDFVLVSVDPHPWRAGSLRKPLIDWLRQTSCFEEVYNDAVVSAFRVRNGCGDLLSTDRESIPTEPIKMSG